jgi:hypothetical protein
LRLGCSTQVAAHHAEGAVPSVAAVNREEAFLDSGEHMRPLVRLGCSLDATLRCHGEAEAEAEAEAPTSSSGATRELLQLYADEDYVSEPTGSLVRALLSTRNTLPLRSGLDIPFILIFLRASLPHLFQSADGSLETLCANAESMCWPCRCSRGRRSTRARV